MPVKIYPKTLPGKPRSDPELLRDAAEKIRKYLSYNPETGILTWLKREDTDRYVRAWNARYAGAKAGRVHPVQGYITINILVGKKKMPFSAHRIAILLSTGVWPSKDVDHINQNRTDNRLENLRQVSKVENFRNSSRSVKNKSGFTGVCWSKSKKMWQASVTVNYKQRIIGYYIEKRDAADSVINERKKLGFSSNHGQEKSTEIFF